MSKREDRKHSTKKDKAESEYVRIQIHCAKMRLSKQWKVEAENVKYECKKTKRLMLFKCFDQKKEIESLDFSRL